MRKWTDNDRPPSVVLMLATVFDAGSTFKQHSAVHPMLFMTMVQHWMNVLWSIPTATAVPGRGP